MKSFVFLITFIIYLMQFHVNSMKKGKNGEKGKEQQKITRRPAIQDEKAGSSISNIVSLSKQREQMKIDYHPPHMLDLNNPPREELNLTPFHEEYADSLSKPNPNQYYNLDKGVGSTQQYTYLQNQQYEGASSSQQFPNAHVNQDQGAGSSQQYKRKSSLHRYPILDTSDVLQFKEKQISYNIDPGYANRNEEPHSPNQYSDFYSHNAQIISDTLNQNESLDEVDENDHDKDVVQPITNQEISGTKPSEDIRWHKCIIDKKYKRCRECRRNNGSTRKVRTECEDCQEKMCLECFKKKHKLKTIPTFPPQLYRTGVVSNQRCYYCGEYLGPGSDEDRIVKHTRQCDIIQRRDSYQFGCYEKDCDYNTKKIDVMKQHIRTHTGYRPYKCNYCEAEFKQRANLKQHMMKKHLPEE